MSRHLPALDGVRGLAVLAVMLLHFSLLPIGGSLDGVVGGVLATGWIGVDLFFVLSGFLITGILVDTRTDPRYFRNFYARRSLRIFPLYYAYLIALFVLLPALHPAYAAEHATDDRRWWLWTYLGNVLMGARGWEGMPSHTTHLWSLAVEEQFYLVWPFVVWLSPPRLLSRYCLAAIGLAWATRAWYVLGAENPPAAYVMTLARMDALGIGALVAVRMRDDAAWSPRRLAGSGALLILLGTVWHLLAGRWQPLAPLDPATQLLTYGGLAMLFGGFVATAAAATDGSRWHRWLTRRWLIALGTYSYALYVFHVPIRNAMRLVLDRYGGLPSLAGSQLPAQLGMTVIGISLSYACARVSWQLFERPILSLKRHFEPIARSTLPGGAGVPEPVRTT